jgi:hypothetical protein
LQSRLGEHFSKAIVADYITGHSIQQRRGAAVKNARFFAQDHRDISPLVQVNDQQIAR